MKPTNMNPSIDWYINFDLSNIDSPKSEIIKSRTVEGESCPSYLPVSHDGTMNDYFIHMAGHELGGPTSILWISNLCMQMGKFYAPSLTPRAENPELDEPNARPVANRSELKFLEIKQSSFLITPHQAGHNFFHFLIDSLPRFHFKYNFARFSKPIIFSGIKEIFHSNSMELLLHKKYPLHDPSHRVLLRECAMMWPLPRTVAVDFLRKKSARVAADTSLKRIFISRRNASYRRITNEFELTPILKKFGFTVIECESLSFSQQVALFKGVDIVCAPHGAGLTNIAFCKENTSVLEIILDERLSIGVGSAFWELACAGKLEYHILSANRIPIDEQNPADGDMYVDPQKFEAALHYLTKHRK